MIAARLRSLLAIAAIALAADAASAEGGTILNQLPETIDPDGRYVFYAHGAVAEGTPVERPYSADWGTYKRPELEAALSDPAWQLVVHRRPRRAPVNGSAMRIIKAIERLIDQGVAADHIALVGFSKGGQITSIATTRMEEHQVRVVLLGTCWDWLEKAPNVQVAGTILSVRDESDKTISCDGLAKRGDRVLSFEEIVTNIGDRHGSFFAPHDEWVKPVKAWLREKLDVEPATSE